MKEGVVERPDVHLAGGDGDAEVKLMTQGASKGDRGKKSSPTGRLMDGADARKPLKSASA